LKDFDPFSANNVNSRHDAVVDCGGCSSL